MSDTHTSPLIVKRTASGGSILFFPVELVVDDALLASPFLRNKERETLQLLIHSQQFLDEQLTISVNEIAELNNFVAHTFKGRLRNLRAKGLLKKVPFKFSDGTHQAKVACEVVDLSPLHQANTEEIAEVPMVPSLAARRWADKEALQQAGCDVLPKVSRDNLPRNVRFPGNNPVEQMINPVVRKKGRGADKDKAPDREQVRYFYVKTPHRTKKIPARVRSYNNIMDPEDLQVLYSCYSLIYNFHKSKLATHQQNGTLPRNLTPIHINHIIDVLGRSRGGPNRSFVRDCLQAIADTSYDFHALVDVEFEDGMLSGYAQKTFRNFESFTPLSEKAPEVDKSTGRLLFGESATIYLITLPESIFERLMQQDTLFVFPKNSLVANAFLFVLYLRFRALCKAEGYEDSLSNLNKKLSPQQSFKSFKSTLINAFKDMAKVNDDFLWYRHDEENNEYVFNLWGYHGKISFNTNILSVVCHDEEMLACCDVQPNSKAPIIENEISSLYYEQKLLKSISRQLSSDLERRFLKFSVLYTVETSDGQQEELELHKYVADNQLEALIQQLSETHAVQGMAIDMALRTDMESISGLVLLDYELNREQFYRLLSLAKIDIEDRHVIELIQRLSRNKKLHSDLYYAMLYEEPLSPSTQKSVDKIVLEVKQK